MRRPRQQQPVVVLGTGATKLPVHRVEAGDPNWSVKCSNCGMVPTVEPTQLCGPCCFGEADTIGGNW